MDEVLSLIPYFASCGSWLAATVTLLAVASSGKPRWSAPLCAECGYDLRGRNPDDVPACPECGSDLTARRAVLFMRHEGRRWGLTVWAAVLLLMPFIFLGLATAIEYYRALNP